MSTIHLDRDTDRRLTELATATGKPPEAIVREALAAYLEDREDALAAESVAFFAFYANASPRKKIRTESVRH